MPISSKFIKLQFPQIELILAIEYRGIFSLDLENLSAFPLLFLSLLLLLLLDIGIYKQPNIFFYAM
jgi:hypothetical protein